MRGRRGWPPTLVGLVCVRSADGVPAGEPVLYGHKVYLQFGGLRLGGEREAAGFVGSARSQGAPTATQIIAKQECFVRTVATDGSEAVPYECTWTLLPEHVDDRLIGQGQPVPAGGRLVLSHAFTNKRLACVHETLATDFGREYGVCAHTFTETGKVNKLLREANGRPTANLLSRTETTENLWTLVFA